MERVGGCDREKPRSIGREGKLGLGLGEIPPVPVIRAYRTKTINSRSASSRRGRDDDRRLLLQALLIPLAETGDKLSRCLRVPFRSRGTAVPHRWGLIERARVTRDGAMRSCAITRR